MYLRSSYKIILIVVLLCIAALQTFAEVYDYDTVMSLENGDWDIAKYGSYWDILYDYVYDDPCNRVIFKNTYGGEAYSNRGAIVWIAPIGEVITNVTALEAVAGYRSEFSVAFMTTTNREAPIDEYAIVASRDASTAGMDWGLLPIDQSYTANDGIVAVALGFVDTLSDNYHQVFVQDVVITTEVLYEVCSNEQYDIPAYYSDWTGNPTGPWTAAYAADDWTTLGDWGLMVPGNIGGYDVYVHPTLPFPSFGRANVRWWIAGQDGAWGYAAGALIFECPSDGLYSIVTDWATYDAGGDPIVEHMRIHIAEDTVSIPTVIYEESVTIPSGGLSVWHHDLSQISELQDMPLEAGTKIIFEMNADIAPGYPSVINAFISPITQDYGGYIKRRSYVTNDIGGPGGVGEMDCSVDLYDFAILTEQWMNCVNVNDTDCAVDVYP